MMRALASLLLLALLAGCTASGVEEVKQWMETTKKETPVRVKPLSPPKVFTPFPYAVHTELDPYDVNKLLAELARAQAANANGLAPDTTRRKELLENFPLDTMKMVGVIQKDGVRTALIQMEKAVYQVKAGNYIGQNYGRIVAIGDKAVDIKETVQDAAGDWVERQTRLELQENQK
ncbi:MAG TPA: pilus assembly protein PilP [Burkholderiaceae bacterium]